MKKINSISDVLDILNSVTDQKMYDIMSSYENYKQNPQDDIFLCACTIPELSHIHKKVSLEGYKFTGVLKEDVLKTSNQKNIRVFLVNNLPLLLEEVKEDDKNKSKKRK